MYRYRSCFFFAFEQLLPFPVASSTDIALPHRPLLFFFFGQLCDSACFPTSLHATATVK